MPRGFEHDGQFGPDGQEMDFQRWARVLLDHRWWIAGVTLVFVVAGALYAFLATPIYSATAEVKVQSQSPQILGGPNLVGTNNWAEQQKFYNNQSQIITSQAVMQEAAKRLKLKDNTAFGGSSDPAKALAGMVKVDLKRESSIFRITVFTPHREDAALFANTIAQAYADHSLDTALSFVKKANTIMAEQAQKLQREYEKEQKAYSSALAKSDSYFPQNQKDIIDKRIEALELKLNDVNVKENELSAVIGQMRAWRNKGGDPLSLAAVAQDPTVQQMAQQYNKGQQELSKLLNKFTPKHPEVIKKEHELKALQKRIGQQAQVVLSSYVNQYQALEAEASNLNADLAKLKKQGLDLTEGASQTQLLATSGPAIKKYMDLMYDKMRELNLSATLLSNNVQIVNPADPPGGPVKPNKKMILILSFMLGLMGSVGSVVAFQYFDTRIRSVEDIEQSLGLNLLAMVPVQRPETEHASIESYQTLRTALMYASQNQQKNVILVTAANPREGKSTIVANLANVLAQAGDRVLLMDCDLRRPSLHHRLNAPPGHRGLSNFMADKESKIEDFLVPGRRPNLWVLFSGPIPPNPPEIFSMKRFRQLVNKVSKDFDWVLLDSPPCLSITDAQILSRLADLVLLVARYKDTKRPMLERAIVTLERLQAQIAGVVLNAVDSKSSYYYDYYYANHYYYRNGEPPKKLHWLLGRDPGRRRGKSP